MLLSREITSICASYYPLWELILGGEKAWDWRRTSSEPKYTCKENPEMNVRPQQCLINLHFQFECTPPSSVSLSALSTVISKLDRNEWFLSLSSLSRGIFMYKIVNNDAPDYLTELFFSGASLWNSLPPTIKPCVSFSGFQRHMRVYLSEDMSSVKFWLTYVTICFGSIW